MRFIKKLIELWERFREKRDPLVKELDRCNNAQANLIERLTELVKIEINCWAYSGDFFRYTGVERFQISYGESSFVLTRAWGAIPFEKAYDEYTIQEYADSNPLQAQGIATTEIHNSAYARELFVILKEKLKKDMAASPTSA